MFQINNRLKITEDDRGNAMLFRKILLMKLVFRVQ